MASSCRKSGAGGAALVVMAAALLLMTTAWGVRAQADCPSTALVYPFWSLCYFPAVYAIDGEVYTLEAALDNYYGQGLAPEWDESNSTYYVRLSEDPATYQFTYITREIRSAVAQEEDLMIVNVATGRSLGWRQEGDEYFLIEVESDVARLQFLYDDSTSVSLPCPLIYGARCQIYSILSYNSSSGLSPYVEDSAVYFKQSSDSLLPFVLRHTSNSSIHAQHLASVV